MADAEVPKIGDIIHKKDMNGFVTALNASSGTWKDKDGNNQSKIEWSTQTFGGNQSAQFTTIGSLHEPATAGTNGGDTALVQRKAVVDALDNVLKNNTELLSDSFSGGTRTISNILNYRLIGIYVLGGSGQWLSGATCVTPWHLVNFCYDSSHRLVLSTDTLYYAIYFPSATSVACFNYYTGTGDVPFVKIVGIW